MYFKYIIPQGNQNKIFQGCASQIFLAVFFSEKTSLISDSEVLNQVRINGFKVISIGVDHFQFTYTIFVEAFGYKMVVHATGMCQKSFIAAQASGDKGLFRICHEMPNNLFFKTSQHSHWKMFLQSLSQVAANSQKRSFGITILVFFVFVISFVNLINRGIMNVFIVQKLFKENLVVKK